MAEITFAMPDGSAQSATVDDSFKTLSPDDRDKVLKELQQAALNSKDRGLGSTLQAGAASAEGGLRSTAKVVGGLLPDGTPGKQTLTDFGNNPQQITAPKNYAPAMGDIKDALHQGNYLDALKSVPRAALEALPDVVGGVATGALATAAAPEALAGAAGALGAGAYMGARSFGDNVNASAANNNHQTPTTGDVVRGGLTTLPEAALGAVGIRPGVLPVVGKAIEGASPLVRGAAEVAGAGAGGAAMDATAQLGTSVGTDKGTQFDPSQSAAAGLAGAGARGITEVPAVAREAALRATMKASGVGRGPMNVDTADTTNRVADAVQTTGAQIKATTGRTPTADEVANTIHAEVGAQILAAGRALRDQGAITPDEFKSNFEVAFKQANTHNRELVTGVSEEGMTSAYSRLENNPNIPVDVKATILKGLQDLNALSEASRKNRGDGPFQQLLGGLGHVAGFVGAIATGNPMDLVASLGGRRSIGATIGSRLGAGVDKLIGTNQPRVMLEQDRAQGILKQAGVTPSGPTLPDLQALNARLQDPAEVARMSLGVKPDDGRAPVAVQGPNDLRPSMMTPAQMNKGQDLQERAGSWMEQQVIAQAKARAAAQQAQQKQVGQMDAQQSAGAMQDSVALQQRVQQEAAQRVQQEAAMAKQNDAQRAADAAVAQQKDQAFQQAEAQAAAAKQAQETQMATQAAVAQKQDAASTARDTRLELAQRQQDLVAQQAVLRSAQRVRQQDAANAEQATTANERAADKVSGIAYRNSRDAREAGLTGATAIGRGSPASIFEATNGRLGSPEGHSDPLMVKSDGSPVAAAIARAPMNPRARAASQKLAEAPADRPATTPAPPEGTGSSGLPEGGMRYVQRITQSHTGKPATPAEITKAIGDLVQADLIPTDIGQAFLDAPHARITSDLAKAVSAQVLRNRGREDLLAHTAGTVQTNQPLDQQTIQPTFGRMPGDAPMPNGGDRPIRNMGQFASKTDANRAFEAQQASQFDTSWPALATAVRQIAIVKNTAEKKVIAQAFLKALPKGRGDQADRYETAAQVLSGPILKGI